MGTYGWGIDVSPTHFLSLVTIANCFTHLKSEEAQDWTMTMTPVMTLLGDITCLLLGERDYRFPYSVVKRRSVGFNLS